MTMRITMTQTRMGESGSLLTSGSTYTVSDAFGAAMVGAGYATDTDAALTPPESQPLRLSADGTALVSGDGTNNAIFQASSRYKFFIPGQQFIGAGNAKDRSGNSADATLMSSLSDAEAWANPGYLTTKTGTNGGAYVALNKFAFDLATQSVIFSARVKRAEIGTGENWFGCGDASTFQGFYLSYRGTGGKLRPVLNTSGGVVSGLADSTAKFAETVATDHVVTLAIDGITKSVYLWCDGCLSNTYAAAFTGGTNVTLPFAFGAQFQNPGVTTYPMQISGVHMLVMNGGLPLNMALIAQKLAANPHQYLTDADLVF